MSAPRTLLLHVLAAMSLVAVSACGRGDDSGTAEGADSSWGSGGMSGGESSTGAGSSGAPEFGADDGDDLNGDGGAVEEDVVIPPPPVSQEQYTRLCGEGCTPGGEPDGCGSGGGMSSGGAGTDAPASQPLHCQLAFEGGDAIPICQPVGRFAAGGPCQRGTDCAAGLGCVAGEEVGGVCRQYCCGDVEGCDRGTYCDERPMAESVGQEGGPVSIPVCVPAVNCQLLNDSACPAGLTCTIVREDGTTSCVAPGEGRTDEPCPCAPGFVCSRLTNQCKQLCRIDGGAQDCGMGAKCQGGSAIYPTGFGVCVSTR